MPDPQDTPAGRRIQDFFYGSQSWINPHSDLDNFVLLNLNPFATRGVRPAFSWVRHWQVKPKEANTHCGPPATDAGCATRAGRQFCGRFKGARKATSSGTPKRTRVVVKLENFARYPLVITNVAMENQIL